MCFSLSFLLYIRFVKNNCHYQNFHLWIAGVIQADIALQNLRDICYDNKNNCRADFYIVVNKEISYELYYFGFGMESKQ